MADIQSIVRRRAFRDGYHDGKHGAPMRQYAHKRWQHYYSLGRIFANFTSDDLRLFEQRRVSEVAVNVFARTMRGFLRA